MRTRLRTSLRASLMLLALCLAGCARDGGSTSKPVATPERVLAGSVRSRGTGGPVVHATVAILDGPDTGKAGLTGTDGRYRIEHLSAGAFSVQATAPDFDALTQPMTLGDGSSELPFRLTRAPCQEARCDQLPSACNETLPLLQPPFDGTALATNLFDHQFPRSFSDGDPAFVSYCGGGNRSGGMNGHSGYDWALPEGTPLLAVADGTVTFAGTEASFYCPLLNRDTAGLWLQIETRSAYGERFWVQYLHLSQFLASAGQAVRAGEAIALSGNTGCSTGPHLHLQIYREFGNREIGADRALVDPNGWQGPRPDPWSLQASGASSAWLWIQSPRSRHIPDSLEPAQRQLGIQDMNSVPAPRVAPR